MEQEISDALKAGETWETLVNKGYIVKGEAESVFQFTGSNHFMFTAGVLERLGDKINLVSKIALSYPSTERISRTESAILALTTTILEIGC